MLKTRKKVAGGKRFARTPGSDPQKHLRPERADQNRELKTPLSRACRFTLEHDVEHSAFEAYTVSSVLFRSDGILWPVH